MGGPDVPGIGFAIGMERLALIMPPVRETRPKLFLACVGEGASAFRVPLLKAFSQNNLPLLYSADPKSLKSQMRHADSLGAAYVLILAGDELQKGIILLRNMRDGSQSELPLDVASLPQRLEKLLVE